MVCRGEFKCRPQRPGTTIFEAVTALALLVAAAAVFAQFYSLAARQQRSAENRAAAHQALANWMERCSLVPFEQLDEEQLMAMAELDPLRDRLPTIEPAATISSDEGPPAARRLTLSLHWQTADGVSVETVELVGWRFAPSDAEEPRP